MRFACYSWWLPPPRRLGATRIIERRKMIVSGSDRGDCEGFLTFPRQRAKRYCSGLLIACGSPSCVGCAAPNCGFSVWCLLAREPPSESLQQGHSLPASKWTSGINHCVILSWGFHWFSRDWLIIACHVSITSLAHPCIYFPSVAKLFSVISFES